MEVHYPDLTPCRVVLNGSAGSGSGKPPVRLPAAVLAAARATEPPPVYDFGLEKKILQTAEDRKQGTTSGVVTMATSEDEIKTILVSKMKHLTSAKEDACQELLEQHKYNLQAAVEAYFSR